MAFDVQDFRSGLVGDGARPNLFQVNLSLPAIAGANRLEASSKITLFCRAAQIPGLTNGVATLPYFGREAKFAGNRKFGDWTITVINDEDFLIRNAFERWMNGIVGHRSNVRDPSALTGVTTSGISSGYTVDMTVTQFSKLGADGIPVFGNNLSESQGLKSYKFIGAFPTELSPIDLNWGTDDTIEEFTVTFAYQWWETIDTTS